MKYIIVFLLSVGLLNCSKKADENCTAVTITSSAPGCNGWGILVNGTKYPSANIPDQFKQDGLAVCANYELYQDGRFCMCCGGTWANVKSMRIFIR